MKGLSHFFTKVAGVTFSNQDGMRRQDILTHCVAWEEVLIGHETDNPKSEHAVSIMRANGEQLGYFKSGLGEEIIEGFKNGVYYNVFITEITGRDKDTLGCNIAVVQSSAANTDDEIKGYVAALKAAKRQPRTTIVGSIEIDI